MRGKLLSGAGKLRRDRITPAHAGKTAGGGMSSTTPEDHPRACGENLVGHRGMVAKSGSPPRMRGKPNEIAAGTVLTGITPAHAGKTSSVQARKAPPQDHPRACGENCNAFDLVRIHKGSPPRMRGKRDSEARRAVAQRITPAHAGKTATRSLR